jgi:TolB-like protein/Tfp pilus assembly protein PilF
MVADIVGYTTMMQQNEPHALRKLHHYEDTIRKQTKAFEGEIVKTYGDGCLILFSSAVRAIHCAIAVQKELRSDPVVPLRLGIHIGEIVRKDNDIFGNGVNVASRIESMGIANSILISSDVYTQIKNHPEFKVRSLGEFDFKNVEREMELFAVLNEDMTLPIPKDMHGKGKRHLTKFKWKAGRMVMGIFLLLFSGFFIYRNYVGPPTTEDGIQSVAVLPFDNYSSKEEHQFFAEAIADQIRSQLLKIKNLNVISGYSSKHFKGLNLSSEEIGKKLGVTYIVQGNVQRSDDLIKVGVELSNTQTNNLEWSPDPFEQDISDLFKLENKIAKQIVAQLSIRLTPKEQAQLNALSTQNPEAYQIYLQADELLHRNRSNMTELNQAIDLFQKATALDPEFDEAFLGLAEAHLTSCLWGRIAAKEGLPLAQAALKNVEDQESAEYNAVMGAINYNQGDLTTAEHMLERALSLKPNLVLPYFRLAWIKNMKGQKEAAYALIDAAHASDPLDPIYYNYKGLLCYYNQDFQEGIDIIDDGLSEYANDNFLKWTKGYLLSGMGEYNKAIDILTNRSVAKQTNWVIGYCYGKRGDTEKAQAVLDHLLSKRKLGHVPAHMIASVYIGMGDKENAIKWLVINAKEGGHEHFHLGLGQDIKFDPLKGDLRFEALIKPKNN